MKYIIYKVTNTINNKYYIGRHITTNIDDGYMGSGIGIKNAIKKYGVKNFVKEIIAESWDSTNLWELEKLIVNKEVVDDKLSYNMCYGGKHYLHGLQTYDRTKFIKHQREAGFKGGTACYNSKTENEKKLWHSKGGEAAAVRGKQTGSHPFYNGTAASLGGKALKGTIDLWNPTAIATNKNQKEYKTGDCKKVKPDSPLYFELLDNGWLPIKQHMQKLTKE